MHGDLAEGFTVRELEQAMEDLFAAGRIQANTPVVMGADRKWKTGIARVGAGRSDAP